MKKTIVFLSLAIAIFYYFKKDETPIESVVEINPQESSKIEKIQDWASRAKKKQLALAKGQLKEYFVEEICDGNHSDGPMAYKPHAENVKVFIQDEVNQSGYISFDYYIPQVKTISMEGSIAFGRFMASQVVEGENGEVNWLIQGKINDLGDFFNYSFTSHVEVLSSPLAPDQVGKNAKGPEEFLRVFKSKKHFDQLIASVNVESTEDFNSDIPYPDEYQEEFNVEAGADFSGTRNPAIDPHQQNIPDDTSFADAQDELQDQGYNFDNEM